jgi:hypothetical protein
MAITGDGIIAIGAGITGIGVGVIIIGDCVTVTGAGTIAIIGTVGEVTSGTW